VIAIERGYLAAAWTGSCRETVDRALRAPQRGEAVIEIVAVLA
jgi:hypothetical protein